MTEALKDLNPILPSLGLLYLASSVRAAGFGVEIVDAQLLELATEEAIELILQSDVDLIGITCWTCNYHRVLRLCDLIKARSTTPIVLGGPHVTMHAQSCIEDLSVDFIVRGEGEVTLVELMRTLDQHGAQPAKPVLERVAGIGFKSAKEAILTAARPQIGDLDSLPFPAWDLVELGAYRPAPQHYRSLPSASVITSRGCPFSCTFCDSIAIWTRSYRLRSVDNVLQELWYLYREFGVTDINFWDDLWGLKKSWALEFCDRLEREGPPGLAWTCECRVDTVGKELLQAMADAGCWSVFYGIESLDQEALEAIRKGCDRERIYEATRWAAEAGIEVRANFIVGLPHDTPEKARAMLADIQRLDLAYVKFSVLTPFPGTALYDQIKSGLYGEMTEDMSRLNGHTATFVPFGYENLEEVDRTARWLTRRYHLRWRYIYQRLLAIRSAADIKKYWRGFLSLARG